MKKLYLYALVMILAFYSKPLMAQDHFQGQRGRKLPGFGGRGFKSESKALSIALTNTVMPMVTGMAAVALFNNNTVQSIGAGLTAYGLLVGPSTGNFYAEDYARGMTGMGVRALGGFLMIDATAEIFGSDFADALHVDNRNVSLTDTQILIGEALVVGTTVFNILSSRRSAREYNKRSRFSLNLKPAIINSRITPLLSAHFRW